MGGLPASLLGCQGSLPGMRSVRGRGHSNVLTYLNVATGIAEPEVLGAAGGRGSWKENFGGRGERSWQPHGAPLWAGAGQGAVTFLRAGW